MPDSVGMTIGRRSLIVGLLLLPVAARAGDYPSRPIRLIVPYLAGGSGDVTARVVAQVLSVNIGQSVFVDNRPGAGGNIGMNLGARATPDGYVLVESSTPLAINATLYSSLPFDTLTAFEPITTTVEEPNILVVGNAVPVASVKDLIDLAKAKPGQLTYASSGNGTVTHLSGELFRSMAGIDITHVPYRGVPPALTDTMSGRTTMFFSGQGAASSFIKSGKLKALATTGIVPASLFPDLPTVAATLPGYQATVWIGIMAPAKTPQDIIAMLNGEIRRALESPEARSKLEEQGYRVIGSSPEEFGALIAADVKKWGAVVRATGAKID
jgi:tripartite-type tricarboxylate transporter receptor subunit TctC